MEISTTTAAHVASSHGLTRQTLTPGAALVIPPAAHGRLWQYLAVEGGFDIAPVLGSRSTDTMAGIGPEPPHDGQRIAAGAETGTPAVVDQVPLAELADRARVTPGPRRDWFTDASWDRLTGGAWTVTNSSRVGVRLAGEPLDRLVSEELPSEGLVRGAIQVPPSGEPVMMLADHPTTGGYPVIAVVHPDDVATVAQHSAGTSIRFTQYG